MVLTPSQGALGASEQLERISQSTPFLLLHGSYYKPFTPRSDLQYLPPSTQLLSQLKVLLPLSQKKIEDGDNTSHTPNSPAPV